MALFVQSCEWGLFSNLQLSYGLEIILAVLLLDFVIYLQHATFHFIPLFWRLHRVHHSVLIKEYNSNFGFNLPWWDRLMQTYRA